MRNRPGPAPEFPPHLVELVRARYRLDWNGTHGWGHWLRVRENGIALAAETGADAHIVILFALFHDSCRHHDGGDWGHGPRAAAFVESLAPAMLGLNLAGRGLLADACRRHTEGLTLGHVTVQTCWDADRLDLGRIGTRPHPKLLCTEAARRPGVIERALQRSQSRD